MGLMGTVVGVGDAIGELMAGEQAVGLDEPAFAVAPGCFDRVEPRTFDRPVAGDDPDTHATLLDLTGVVTAPVADLVADVPGGVVPDQPEGIRAVGVELAAAPVQGVAGDGAAGPAIAEPEPPVVGGGVRGRVSAQQQASAGQ